VPILKSIIMREQSSKEKLVSICDVRSKEQFKEWLRSIPLNYPPKREDCIAEKAMMYDKCIWSKYSKEDLDPGLNFFKFV
jgi:hypothetical protein